MKVSLGQLETLLDFPEGSIMTIELDTSTDNMIVCICHPDYGFDVYENAAVPIIRGSLSKPKCVFHLPKLKS